MSGYSDFAMKLTQQCYQSGQNLCLSPYSVRIAFSMAMNGARGETLRQMAKVLGYSSFAFQDINRENELSLSLLLNKTGPEMLESINGIWLSKRDELNPDYVRRVTTVYRTEVGRVDFTQRQALEQINGWVKKQTDGKLTSLFERLDRETVMVMANIISFLGIWEAPFDPRKTVPQQWTKADGSKIDVQMMSRDFMGNFDYTDDHIAVKMDYKSGKSSMYLIMPMKRPINQFVKQMNATAVDAIISRLKFDQVKLLVPRFDIASPINLVPALAKMGMALPFGRNADFSDMTRMMKSGLFIGQAVQKCAVTVNETGTKAVAATGIEMFKGKPSEVRFDKPFVFIIRHDPTGELLFTGVVCEPEKAYG
jgi:serpin B